MRPRVSRGSAIAAPPRAASGIAPRRGPWRPLRRYVPSAAQDRRSPGGWVSALDRGQRVAPSRARPVTPPGRGPPGRTLRVARGRANLLHLDTKLLGRIRPRPPDHRRSTATAPGGVGYEHVHVAIDDATRVAYVEVRPRSGGARCAASSDGRLVWFDARRARRRVLTDNGSGVPGPSRSRAPAAAGACATSARGPTRRAPTARPSASSRPSCGNGPTRGRMPAQPADRRHSRPYLRYYNHRRPHTSLGRPVALDPVSPGRAE